MRIFIYLRTEINDALAMTKDEKRELQRRRLMDNKAYQTMEGLTRYMDRYYLDALIGSHRDRSETYIMMKKTILIFTLGLLVSCNNKQSSNSNAEDELLQEDTLMREPIDSMRHGPDDGMPPPPPRGDNPPPKPPSGGRHGDNPPPKPDNMRGFDPASEDDMPDNGMSRFMENNDEEGWD